MKAGSDDGDAGGRRPRRRVVAPGTSGQPEEQEAQPVDPLGATGPGRGTEHEDHDEEQDQRAQWLKTQRPPHW